MSHNIAPFPTAGKDFFTVTKILILRDTTKATRAFVDIRVGPMIISGFAVVTNRKGGMFVASPARFHNNKNYPYVTLDKDVKERFDSAILKAYEIELQSHPAAV